MNDIRPPASLAALPPPPPGKTGWPWTVESPLTAVDECPRGDWPRISVVTPNYNYGAFLEETIRSVLLQRYPNTEIVVVDGGSKDDSVAIIRKYEPWITRWVSEPDRGQAHAINKGFGWITGQVCNWLNSDDVLMPGALRVVAEAFAIGDLDWLAGGRLLKDASGVVLELQLPWVTEWPRFVFNVPDFPQEATFFSKRVWDRVGGIDTEYDCSFDVDFYHRVLRASQAGALTKFPVGAMNSHAAQKTLSRPQSATENQRIQRQIYAGRVLSVVRRLSYSRFWGILDAGLHMTMRSRGRRYQYAEINPLSGRVSLRPWEGP